MGIFNALRKVFFGDKEPEEVLDSGIAKTDKEILVGKGSKTGKAGGVAPGGNNSPAPSSSATAKLGALGAGTTTIGAIAAAAKKDEDLVNSAIRDIRSGKYTTAEQKAAIERFQTRIDNAVAAGVVPSQKDQQTFLNLREARAFSSYQSIKEQAKDPKASAIVKDIASRPYQKDMSNPWKNFKGYDADTVLKVYGVRNPEKLNDRQMDQKLEEIMRKNPAARTAIEKTYGATVTPFKSPANAPKPGEEKAIDAMNNITKSKDWGPWDAQNPSAVKFKQYPDEPLNPRIGKVTPFVDEKTVYLNMIVDGKEKNLTISNKNTVDAFNAGALPLNVLANKSLAIAETMQANLQSRFELIMDEHRGQEQSQSMGMRR